MEKKQCVLMELMSADTNHFSHDASSHMFCSHFFDEILQRLFDIDHQHHANEPNDANLTTEKMKKIGKHQSMNILTFRLFAMLSP